MIDLPPSDKSYKTIFGIGGIVCMILIAYSLITVLLLVTAGSPPSNAKACYDMLHENRLMGLLRLDILTYLILPLYFLLFFSLYVALKKADYAWVTISTIFVFAGLTLVLATPSVLSLLNLSDKYTHATNDFQRNQFLAAGEAILASDIWHGTGAYIGGLMLQTGAVIISLVMLKTNIFNKPTAIAGIITHGLDLLHIIVGFFMPATAIVLMAIAGPLYLIWFPMVGLRLFKISHMED